jgi:uncharacterized membrane protein
MINFLDEPIVDFPRTVNGGLSNTAIISIIISVIVVIVVAIAIVSIIKSRKNV